MFQAAAAPIQPTKKITRLIVRSRSVRRRPGSGWKSMRGGSGAERRGNRSRFRADHRIDVAGGVAVELRVVSGVDLVVHAVVGLNE